MYQRSVHDLLINVWKDWLRLFNCDTLFPAIFQLQRYIFLEKNTFYPIRARFTVFEWSPPRKSRRTSTSRVPALGMCLWTLNWHHKYWYPPLWTKRLSGQSKRTGSAWGWRKARKRIQNLSLKVMRLTWSLFYQRWWVNANAIMTKVRIG